MQVMQMQVMQVMEMMPVMTTIEVSTMIRTDHGLQTTDYSASEVEAPTIPILEMRPLTQEELEKLYRVIILNDDVTTFEFVIVSLVIVFEVEPDRAEAIAWETHTRGEAYVATLPREEAYEKVHRVQLAAREEGYPLQFVIEPEA